MADQCINSNPDIAGIGVRINFYVTILITAFTPKNEYTTELLDGLYLNAILYGLGLVITAVIQTMQNQLDLYHAVCVMHNILSLEFVYVCGQIRFMMTSKHNFRMKTFIAVQMTSSFVFLIWLLFVWNDSSNFGSQPECNHLVKFALFFVDIMATDAWLGSLIVGYVLTYLSGMLFIFTVIFLAYFRNFIRKKFRIVVDTGAGLGQAIKGSLRGGIPSRAAEYGLVAISAAPAVYCVVTFELIVHRNHSIIKPGENDFGFGQIIALVLLFGSIVDIVAAIREWHKRKGKGSSPKPSYEQLPDEV